MQSVIPASEQPAYSNRLQNFGQDLIQQDAPTFPVFDIVYPNGAQLAREIHVPHVKGSNAANRKPVCNTASPKGDSGLCYLRDACTMPYLSRLKYLTTGYCPRN